MSTTVIYHRADFDGIFCREIARKFLPGATLVGWDYGDPVPPMPPAGDGEVALYMLDISVDGLMDYPGLTWIDHHKSAMEKFPGSIAGYRIDGVAACRLAWQWFSGFVNKFGNDTPTKEDYVERRVTEPWAVRLAGEYDIWDKRDLNAELFQHGLRSEELFSPMWDQLLSDHGDGTVTRLLNQGRALQYAKTQENASIIKSSGFTVDFEGLCFLACNAARYNSHLFTAGILPEHDALLGFNYDGKGRWRVSLYHAPGKEHHDLSLIAVKHGGGGHRGACGFRATSLPFLTTPPATAPAA